MRIALVAAAIAGCSGAPGAASPAAPAAPVEITILFTSDEHGWISPHAEHDTEPRRGGAAEVLAQWVAREGHCPGPPSPPCPDPHTLALSGGDNYTGPAISSYFGGVPMADAMARMGYTASALGNHDFDFGRARFLEVRARSHIQYLAANLRPPARLPDAKLPAFAIYERRGIKIGVVGLATDTTLETAMASLFEGITFEADEPALVRATREAWAAGADAVVAIAHECPEVLAPIVERHPELHLAFVGAGHRGPITKSILWSILPFDNKVVVLRLRGKDLIANLDKKTTAASGVVKLADGHYRLETGAPIDPEAIYSLATIDYLYFGGAGYTLHDLAVSVDSASRDWRDPVIAWTRKQGSTQATPLVLRPPPASAP